MAEPSLQGRQQLRQLYTIPDKCLSGNNSWPAAAGLQPLINSLDPRGVQQHKAATRAMDKACTDKTQAATRSLLRLLVRTLSAQQHHWVANGGPAAPH
jgi:hypothetical protein